MQVVTNQNAMGSFQHFSPQKIDPYIAFVYFSWVVRGGGGKEGVLN